jgi:hypothetical protein
MIVMTPFMKELEERFPRLFNWWERDKLLALGFREGDIDVIHQLFGTSLLHTGILVLLAFTHGDSYPVCTIASTFNVSGEKVVEVLSELTKRQIIYTEKFGHPTQGLDFYFADRDLLLSLVREHKLINAKRRFAAILPSEERLLVFVSSVMDKELENLEAERNIARIAIEDVGFTRPWLFEETPASSEPLPDVFLKKVKKADLFVLIIGKHITDNVEVEYKAATESNVSCLVFLKKGIEQTNRTRDFIREINVKYKEFHNPNDLRHKISASLIDEVLKQFRNGRRAR